MADKEERILVLKATEDDFIYKHFNGKGFIPRQEAIKRMAKAIICRACEDYLHEDTDPLTSSASAVAYAEAALNALLENKK